MIAVALAVAILIVAARAARRAASRRRAAGDRAVAEDLLAAFAAELDAGAGPDAALRSAVTAAQTGLGTPARGPTGLGSAGPADAGELGALAAGLAAGTDPARLLASCGTPALRKLGAALLVCRSGGARLAPVARELAGQAQADARRAGELATALAAPRSSGRLVAGLPLLGLAFAALLGAGPVHVLLGTPAGSACLLGGVLLDLAGLRWLRWTADRVTRRVEPPTGPGRPPRRTIAAGSGRAGRARRERLLADLPLALDLVAACLAAGATVPAALEATAHGVGGPLGAELRVTAQGLRLGAPVERATARLVAAGLSPPGPLTPLLRRARRRPASRGHPLLAAAQALGRVETSGARLAEGLTRIAARARAQAHDDAIAAARRAGVAAVAPLGLCFLPAFLLLGVVPTILGSLHGLLPTP